MKCPECGAECWREEVDIGVGVMTNNWMCTECSWTEDQAFPMKPDNWDEWLNEGPAPDAYIC